MQASMLTENRIHESLLKFTYPVNTQALLSNAQAVLSNISIRLAHRLQTLRNLPYLIVLNPNVSQIYSIYLHSFIIISQTKPPTTLDENKKVVQVLKQLVNAHADTIQTLARGFHEARGYISEQATSEIIDSHLRARIGTRLIAEHHIALTDPIDPAHYIGAVEVDCKPSTILKQTADFVGDICDLKFGQIPTLRIEQGEGITFPYVPVHIEYIFTELLKNAFRATVENAQRTIPRKTMEPVWATIVKTSTGVIIRIRDRGGGIMPELERKVFDYSFTTFSESSDDSEGINSPPQGNSIAGMGYGLPLSRAYAEFFGGRLQIQSYYGWGTDVYVTLKSVK